MLGNSLNPGCLLTVGLLSYRRPVALRRCLASLWACTREPVEVRVVNQGYLDPELEALYRDPRLQVTYLQENTGCSAGRRLLAAAVQTPFLFFADDDLVFRPGWLEPLLGAMRADPELGAVAPYLVQRRLPFCGRFEWRDGRLLLRRFGRGISRAPRLVQADFLPGGCVLVRRQVFEQAAFDPLCRACLEDVDFWLQLRASGWRLCLCPASRVDHRRPFHREYDAQRYDPARIRQTQQYFLGKWRLPGYEVCGPRWRAWLDRLLQRLLPWYQPDREEATWCGTA